MKDMYYFFQQLINGLSCGSIYAMIAIGYSMVYGLLYLVNFAHGDLYVFGTFIAYTLIMTVSSVIHPIFCCLIAAIITGGIGIVIERTAYRPVRNANRMVPMISAFGVALILKTIAQVIWGPEAIPFKSLLPSSSIEIGGLQIYTRAIVIPVISLAVVVAMQFVLNRTKLGRGTRCIMQDIQTSSLMGIPTNTIIPLIYALGGFLGVLGGVLYCSYYGYISVDMGMLGTIKAWAVVMLGGVGNFWGAFFGGIILGVAESMAGAYVGTAFRDAMGYIVIVIVLMFRPQGLFGTKKAEKV